MAQNKVLAYLKSREGQEVTFDELLGAETSPNERTLSCDLSILSRTEGNGVTRIAQVGRKRSTYRYDSPESVSDLHVIGKTREGLTLVQDAKNKLYELRELLAA